MGTEPTRGESNQSVNKFQIKSSVSLSKSVSVSLYPVSVPPGIMPHRVRTGLLLVRGSSSAETLPALCVLLLSDGLRLAPGDPVTEIWWATPQVGFSFA